MKVVLQSEVDKGMGHEQRMAIAKEIAERCLIMHGEKIAAIGVYGTTAIGKDMPYSDLDMTVLTHTDLDMETKCYPYRGVPINLDYQSVQETIEVEANVPGEGGCWTSFLPLYDPTGIVPKLRETYQALPDSAFQSEFEKRIRGRLLTYICKIRNAVLSNNRAYFVRSCQDFGVEVILALALLNREYTTGKALWCEAAKRFRKLPKDSSILIDKVLSAVSTSDQAVYDSCEKLWDNMRELARSEEIDCAFDSSEIRP